MLKKMQPKLKILLKKGKNVKKMNFFFKKKSSYKKLWKLKREIVSIPSIQV